ncbi:uncharacterized protein [Lolium perenne]|uniref:uncharacterized protein n=1 Tax=Lolium perenne TaxID=4522 RepID=UPI0021F617F6|nr:E3 ubiquitin-protein ligase SINA-like 10 [Lolium perenne]
MPRMERSGVEESSSAKKAKIVSAAESAASEQVTVTLDSKLLDCSICLSTLAPPIFQCIDGHMTCLGCSEAVEYDCSVCGESADIRCHAVEKILGGMTTRCSFSEHGCTAIIPFMEKLSHEAFCLHAPCYCPIAGCRPYVRKPLRDHLSMEHPGLQLSGVIAGDLYPMRIGEGESAHVVSLYGTGAAFLLVVDRSVPLAGYTLSVIHLASEPAPGQHDFKYKIQVSTRAGIICLSGKTQSVGCLRSPYQPCASMFVEEDIWDPEYSPVYIELR